VVEIEANMLYKIYKRTRNDYFRSIKQSKTDMWNTYVEEAKGSTVYDLLKQLKPCQIQQTPTIWHNEIETTTFRNKAELLEKVMFPTPSQFQPSVPSTTNSSLPWTNVTNQQIREAIFTSAPKKATGPDGISFLCLWESYNTRAIPTWFH
jgi:hypothetical protein